VSNVRIRFNFDQIRRLRVAPETHALVVDKARRMEAALQGMGAETKTDSQTGPNRARAAVITGYEPGATLETSRRNLLNALDAARD